MPWEHLLAAASSEDGLHQQPMSPEDLLELREILARQMMAEEEEGGQQEHQLQFPALTREQAKLAVNPGYKEFFEDEYKPSERMGEKGELQY